MTINSNNDNVKDLPNLPVEVQTIIANFLTLSECLKCSQVCKKWRLMVFTHWQRAMWHTLSVTDNCYVDENKKENVAGQRCMSKILATYSAYIKPSAVKKVTYFADNEPFMDQKYWIDSIGLLLDAIKCNAIRDIQVRTQLMTPLINHFSRLITTCGATLTNISIAPPKNQLQRWMSSFRPDLLLRSNSYPNLTHFTFTYAVSYEEYVPFMDDNNHDGYSSDNRKNLMTPEVKNKQVILSLTDLTLAIVTTNLDPFPFLQRLPNLKRLALSFSDIENINNRSSFHSMLHQYCPKLESVVFTTLSQHLGDLDITEVQSYHYFKDNDKDIISYNNNNKLFRQQHDGLKNLVMHASTTEVRSIASCLFQQFIISSNSTLKQLNISGDILLSDQIMKQLLSNTSTSSNYPLFPSLTHLILHYGHLPSLNDNNNNTTSSTTFLFRQFLESMPLLASVYIHEEKEMKYTRMDDSILATLIHMKQLHELRLKNCFRLTKQGLSSYLRTCDSTLRKLQLSGTIPAANSDVLRDYFISMSTITTGHLDNDNKEKQQQEQEKEGKEKRYCLCQLWKLEELVLDRLTFMTRTDVESLLDTMCEQQRKLLLLSNIRKCQECHVKKKMKIMNKIHLSLEYYFNPKYFLDSKQGKAFMKKLDSLTNEWKIDFIKNCKITHVEYRKKKLWLQK